jgi:uncharacterized protein with HEPN domain
MSELRDEALRRHILDSVGRIKSYVGGLDEDAFLASAMVQDAVVRQLLIIGEAARHLSAGFKQQHASIPWRKITGMRDKLVQDYLGVDVPVVWHTVTIDLPDLEAKLK